MYLERELLTSEFMGRGYAWLDMGSHDSLLQAGQFIATLENRQGVKYVVLKRLVIDLDGYLQKNC